MRCNSVSMNIFCCLLIVFFGTYCHGFGDLGLNPDEDLQNRLMVCDIKKDRSEEELHQCQREVRHGKRTLEDITSKMTDIEDRLALTSQQLRDLQWAQEDLEDNLRKVRSDSQRTQDKVQRGKMDLEDDIVLAQLQIVTFIIICGVIQSWLVSKTTRSAHFNDVRDYVAKLMAPMHTKVTDLQIRVEHLSSEVGNLVKSDRAPKIGRTTKKPSRGMYRTT